VLLGERLAALGLGGGLVVLLVGKLVGARLGVEVVSVEL
jgi:hypothetical protein